MLYVFGKTVGTSLVSIFLQKKRRRIYSEDKTYIASSFAVKIIKHMFLLEYAFRTLYSLIIENSSQGGSIVPFQSLAALIV